MQDIYNSDLYSVSQIPDVDLAWEYFKSTFLTICDKHAPFKRFRMINRDNPWFNESISSLIKKEMLHGLKQRNLIITWTGLIIEQ